VPVKMWEKMYSLALSYVLAIVNTDVANIIVNSSTFSSLVRSIKVITTDVLRMRFVNTASLLIRELFLIFLFSLQDRKSYCYHDSREHIDIRRHQSLGYIRHPR
jgi:hypothetical protein